VALQKFTTLATQQSYDWLRGSRSSAVRSQKNVVRQKNLFFKCVNRPLSDTFYQLSLFPLATQEKKKQFVALPVSVVLLLLPVLLRLSSERAQTLHLLFEILVLVAGSKLCLLEEIPNKKMSRVIVNF
jgi:hypothetical protein